MAKATGKPKWIWMAADRFTPDVYLRARRTFTLRARPAAARLRITAFTEYVLYVNGRYVGRGPSPSSFEAPLVDVYTGADLPLKRGRNVVAVLAHNLHVGTARHPRLPGGLWADLVVTGGRGGAERIVTDRQWRVAPAEDFSRRAPRLYWTAGFAEVRDTRREPRGWTAAGFSDRRWPAADAYPPAGPPGGAAPRPRDRGAPRPDETWAPPVRVAATGRTAWPAGVTAIPFEWAVPRPIHGEFYAATFVHMKERGRARLEFDCDESAVIYVNNRQVLRQGYKEEFVRWLSSDEQNDYAGPHRGQGWRVGSAEVPLDAGWNSLGVVLYDPAVAWGFALRLVDPRTGRPLDAAFSPDQKPGGLAHWQVVLERICPCGNGAIPETPGPNAGTFPDPAYQLAWERQERCGRASRGAASLCGGLKEGRLVLADGEFAAYDFGRELVGCVEVEADGPPGAILDVAWSEAPPAPGAGLAAVNRGMRQADRLILCGGRQTVRLVNRRALRFVQLVARTGGGGDAVRVYRLGVHATALAPEPPAVPRAKDRDLAGALRLAARTVHVCLQDTLEGSPARDAEQSVPAAFFLDQAARAFLGRADLGEAALRTFAADQAADGFFRAVVPAGTQHVVPDWGLLWIIWLADHVAWTGNRALAADLYPAAERFLEWAASLRDETGLLVNKPDRSPWWLMPDLAPMEKHGIVTALEALYARALGSAAEVAEFLGKADDAAHAWAEAEAIARAARQRLWDAGRGLFVDGRRYERKTPGASPQTNYYALYGGLATDEQAARVLATLWKGDRTGAADWGPHETPYAKYFALEALLARGQVGQALAMIRRYWGAMARAGLATVPEVFSPGDGGKSGGDAKAKGGRDRWAESPYGGRPPEVLCHAWGVHPAALVARWVLGVRPGGPGFEPLLVAPMPGDLADIRGRVWTPRGPVDVAIAGKPRRRKVRVTVPEGMPYRLDRRHLAVEDEVVITGGKTV
jgi:hypothetical protein